MSKPGGRKGLGRVSAGVADVGVSGASNTVFLVAMARSLSVADFGVFALCYSVFVFALTVNRRAIALPLVLDMSPAKDRGLASAASVAAQGAAVLLGLCVSAVIAMWASFGAESTIRAVLLVFALAVPVALVQDVLRFSANAAGRPGVALAGDSIWLAMLVMLFALDQVEPITTVGVWALAALASCVSFAALGVRVRPKVIRGLALLRDDRRRRGALGAEGAVAGGAALSISVLVGAGAGAAALAAFRGAGVLFSPLNTLVTSLGFTLVPEAKRSGKSPARFFAGVSVMLCLVAGV